MNDIEFKATLQMLIPMVIQIIMEKKSISAVEAVKMFYISSLYERLEIEKTKIWHFSPHALFELLETEERTGKLLFPTEGY